jgi:transcription antitermination protein NusB
MTAAGAKPAKAGKTKSGARSAARLAAVQALYQVQLAAQPTDSVLSEFIEHRFRSGDAETGCQAADVDLFCDIVRSVLARKSELEPLIGGSLATGWRFERLDKVMQALLLSAAYELVARPDVPTPVIINEYVELAHAFFEDEQAKFAHAVLDKVAREVRSNPANSG